MPDESPDQPTEPVDRATATESTESVPVTEPGTSSGAAPDTAPVRAARRGVLVPLWALVAIGGLVLFLAGGALGYALGDDDDDDRHRGFEHRMSFGGRSGGPFAPGGPFADQFGDRDRPNAPGGRAPQRPTPRPDQRRSGGERPDRPMMPDARGAFLGVAVATSEDPAGAELLRVMAGGPAARAGLERGDVITTVDGDTVADAAALTDAIRSHQVGDRVEITYSRGGSNATTTVTLGARRAQLTQ